MGLLVENDLDFVAARSTIAHGIASSPRLVQPALDFAVITINYSSHRYDHLWRRKNEGAPRGVLLRKIS